MIRSTPCRTAKTTPLIGVKSTALLFDKKVLTGIFVFHLAATMLITFAAYVAGAGRIGALIGLAFMAHGIWQITRLSSGKEATLISGVQIKRLGPVRLL